MLHHAVQRGTLEVIEALAAHGTDLNIRDRRGEAALMAAATQDDDAAARMLIADLEVEDDTPKTALLLTVMTPRRTNALAALVHRL